MAPLQFLSLLPHFPAGRKSCPVLSPDQSLADQLRILRIRIVTLWGQRNQCLSYTVHSNIMPTLVSQTVMTQVYLKERLFLILRFHIEGFMDQTLICPTLKLWAPLVFCQAVLVRRVWDRVSLCNSCCSGTHNADEADLEYTEISLLLFLSAGIEGVGNVCGGQRTTLGKLLLSFPLHMKSRD